MLHYAGLYVLCLWPVFLGLFILHQLKYLKEDIHLSDFIILLMFSVIPVVREIILIKCLDFVIKDFVIFKASK